MIKYRLTYKGKDNILIDTSECSLDEVVDKLKTGIRNISKQISNAESIKKVQLLKRIDNLYISETTNLSEYDRES